MAEKQNIEKKLDYLDETKALIKDAIETKGQTVEEDATFRSYVENIGKITTGVETEDATATEYDILEHKTAYARNEKLVGKIKTKYKLDNENVLKTNKIEKSKYIIYDYLYTLQIGIVGDSTDNTKLYIAKWSDKISDFDIENAINISNTDFGTIASGWDASIITTITSFASAKFSSDELEPDIYFILLNGLNSSWDTKAFCGLYINIKEFKLLTDNTIITSYTDRFNYSDKTYYTVCANPTNPNQFICSPNNSRTINNKVLGLQLDNNQITFTELIESKTLNKTYVNFCDTGKFFTIMTNDFQVTSIITDLFEIRNDNTMDACGILKDKYYFTNFTLYDIYTGESIKTYTSSQFDNLIPKVIVCVDNSMFIITSTLVVQYIFNEDDLSFKQNTSFAFNLSLEQTNNKSNIIYPQNIKNGFMVGNNAKNGIILFTLPEKETLETLIRHDQVFYNKNLTTLDSNYVVEGNYYYGKDGKTYGTMHQYKDLEIEPTKQDIQIPEGYIVNGKIKAFDITKDSDYIRWITKSKNILGE